MNTTKPEARRPKFFLVLAILFALLGAYFIVSGLMEKPRDHAENPDLPRHESVGAGQVALLWDGYVAGYAVRAGKGYLSCAIPHAKPQGDRWEPGTPCAGPEPVPGEQPGTAEIRTAEQLAQAWLGEQNPTGLSVGILPAFVAHARGDRLRFENDRQILILVYRRHTSPGKSD